MTSSATIDAAIDDPRVGRPVEDVDTPALLLDLDRFERNVGRLITTIKAGGKDWRPHSKGHKSPWIASYQRSVGAVGVTCGKVS
jgi:D-serine deaminase-like pyridoxal phosphate-dependent protein